MAITQPIEEEFLYLQVTNHITGQIQQLTLKTGDKLPSLKALSKEKGISLTTAYKACAQLEMNGLIEARPNRAITCVIPRKTARHKQRLRDDGCTRFGR